MAAPWSVVSASAGGGGGSALPPTPAIGDVLTSTAVGPVSPATVAWEPPGGFAITAFTMATFTGVHEVGASVVNPALTAAYTEVPFAADVTWTNPAGGPTALVTPFTAGVVVDTFTSAVDGASSVATLHATDPNNHASTLTRSNTCTFAGAIVAGSVTGPVVGQALYDNLAAQQKKVQLGRAANWTFASGVTDSQVFGFLTGRGAPTFTDSGTGLPISFVNLGTDAAITENGTVQSVTFYSVGATGINGGITSA